MSKIRILIADDYVPLRQGMRYLLDNEKDLEVVDEAGDGEQAVKPVFPAAAWKYIQSRAMVPKQLLRSHCQRNSPHSPACLTYRSSMFSPF